VEEEEGRIAAAPFAKELGLGEKDADKERLLLAGRTRACRHLLWAMLDDEVGAVRAFERASGRAVSVATGRERCSVTVLDLDGGTC
ncbi:MAG TPA: hypothetical protein PK264_23725, partial [Hyphomicrobiaceae bacterium]|nr:hypothetical protein [Hyphomicrobiaceae bacterium]